MRGEKHVVVMLLARCEKRGIEEYLAKADLSSWRRSAGQALRKLPLADQRLKGAGPRTRVG